MPSVTLKSSLALTIQPLSADQTKSSLIGAEVVLCPGLPRVISRLDLTHEDISTLRQALYDYSVLVIRKQNGIEPSALPQLAKIWDENIVDMHSGGAKAVTDPKNILSRNSAVRTPSCPNVTVIGNGQFKGYMGLEELNLVHVNHTEFHDVPLSQGEIESGQTRFYRWHMDMPCYETLPRKVTLIHGMKIPKAPDQKVVFENGTVLPIAAGATAFVSGALAFSLLSADEQIFALNTMVQYAPRPYEWIRNCKATSDGLTIAHTGREIPLDELPSWENDHVQSHPMVWRNPGRPDQPHLQILCACVHSLKTTDPSTGEITTVDDVAEARRICHTFMKKAMSAEFIYAHAWEEGDLIVFHNQGVLHSITGQLEDEKRLMWQCNMASSTPPERFTGDILIVGSGVFGLSTALHLAQDGFTNIKVLDRATVPSPLSAGNDLNKIVRAEYEDLFYTELALDAIKQWQTPFWAPYYRETGYLLATSPKAPQKSRDSLQKSFSSVKDHPAFPPGSFSPIESVEKTRKQFPMLRGKMDGWSGYLNRYAGYARAAKALEHTANACVELGVKFVMGDSGYAVELLYEAGAKKICTGVKTADGSIHKVTRTILCLGAHISTLLPSIAPQTTAKSWSVAHIRLSPTEAESMKGCPVVNCRDLGFFFEPDPDTGLVKFSANGAGYTNYISQPGTGTRVSVPPNSNEGIPEEDEILIKRLIEEAIPQLSGRDLIKKFICWCSDTADSEYIIDFVPGSEGLMVAAGDSGHAFKMLPVAGKWVKHALLDGEQTSLRWRWKEGTSNGDDISWRAGQLKDIKDVEISGSTSCL